MTSCHGAAHLAFMLNDLKSCYFLGKAKRELIPSLTLCIRGDAERCSGEQREQIDAIVRRRLRGVQHYLQHGLATLHL